MKIAHDLTTKIVKKIDQIPPKEWKSVFPDILESYYFFKSIDESDFEGISFYYIMVYKKDTPVGAAPCFTMDYPLDTTVEGPLKHALAGIKEYFPNIFNLKMLICGSMACEGRMGIAAEGKGPVMRAIVHAMERIAKKAKVSILAFKDFSLSYTTALDLLVKDGFYKTNGYPSVEIDMNFRSFDEYFSTLSRATRKDLKRKFKKVDGHVKIDVEVSDNVDSILEDVYFLYLQNYHKSDVQFEKLPIDFFANISKNMKGEVKYFTWRVEDKLVAFNLCLVSRDVLIDEYVGFDYFVTHKYPLYFITFRDIINWCIKNGVKKYESGALTYEPKKRLGCSFMLHYIYVKHMNRFINPFFKLVCSLVKPDNFDPLLKEMKKKGLL